MECTCKGFCSASDPLVPQPGSDFGPGEAHGDSQADLTVRKGSVFIIFCHTDMMLYAKLA